MPLSRKAKESIKTALAMIIAYFIAPSAWPLFSQLRLSDIHYKPGSPILPFALSHFKKGFSSA